MTPGGYWAPLLRAENDDFGSGVSCSFCPLCWFPFFLPTLHIFFFWYARENSPVQPLSPPPPLLFCPIHLSIIIIQFTMSVTPLPSAANAAGADAFADEYSTAAATVDDNDYLCQR
jgi:hypothetical protein